MRAVIAGGTGSIGKAVANSLARDGYEVFVLTRSPKSVITGYDEGVELKEWQVSSLIGWGPLLDGADVVVNFAGENLAGNRFLPDRWSQGKKERIVQSRILTGQAVNQAIEKAKKKPSVLIQASAIGYYGPRGDEMLNESSGPGSDFLANVCVQWESTTAPVEDYGIRRVVLRTGLMLSTESGPLPRILVRFRLFAGGPFGNGRQWWSWIHIDDVAGAIRFLIGNDAATGPYNLTSPNPVTNREFSTVLGRVLSRPSFIPLPGFALQLLVGEVASVVLDGQRGVPTRLQELNYPFAYPELDKALENLLIKE